MTGVSPGKSGRVAELINQLRVETSLDLSDAFLVRAPLRICPLGAHVDHQGGVVTGMTINREVVLAAIPESAPSLKMESLDFPGRVEVELTGRVPPKTGDWGDYLRAAVAALGESHPLRVGLQAVVAGDLPGAGASSSAAVLVAYLLALMRVNEIDIGKNEIAGLVQQAENEYVGVASGRLDQSIILNGEAGQLVHVDCSDFGVDHVPFPEPAPAFDVLVAFSGVSRTLAASGFNTRVDECRDAARLLLELGGQPPRDNPVLGDVDPQVFERFAADLPRVSRRRATHYFGEQRRVRLGVEAWRSGDLERFGSLMTASGASSIHNYESGTIELITLYEMLRDTPEVFGTRFSGGGFGGSCVALIRPGAAESVGEAVSTGYARAHPEAAANASFHLCAPAGPARVEGLRF
jgi:galactokinase/galacturonokinase